MPLPGGIMQSYRIQAPAKINLHLDIAETGADGFHPLRSLFLMISLFDDLLIHPLNDNRLELSGFSGLEKKDNILYRCWNRARELGYFHQGLSIEVDKRIPQGAGLGGGSSDCAALLKVMGMIEPKGVTPDRMKTLAEEMGSDVPFFLQEPLAYVEGRGEILFPLKIQPDWDILILKPDFSISTVEAYRQLDASRKSTPWKGYLFDQDQLKLCFSKADGSFPFINSFTPMLLKQYPEYQSFFSYFKINGALYCNISGSGSSLFALFRSGTAPSVLEKWQKEKKESLYFAKALDKNPAAVVI